MSNAQRMHAATQMLDTLNDILKDIIIEVLDKEPNNVIQAALELRRDIASTRKEWLSLADKVDYL